ncbi:alpha/beta hydrolase fold domain-containing protein [Azotobacter sp. CWF10]
MLLEPATAAVRWRRRGPHPLPEDLRELRLRSASSAATAAGRAAAGAARVVRTHRDRSRRAWRSAPLHAAGTVPWARAGPAVRPWGWLVPVFAGGSYDGPCRALANASGCAWSPPWATGCSAGRPFPVPLYDIADAWRWLRDRAERRRPGPTAAGDRGDSAGGSLAAACCLLLRETGACRNRAANCCCIRRWMPAWTAIPTATTPLATTHQRRRLMQRCWQAYLGDLAEPPAALRRPTAAEPEGAGAPPPCSASEHDPAARDEAEYCARRLQAAGVGCTQERLPGMIHACIHLQAVSTATAVAVQRAGDLLRRIRTKRPGRLDPSPARPSRALGKRGGRREACRGAIAQLGERVVRNDEVGSSIALTHLFRRTRRSP